MEKQVIIIIKVNYRADKLRIIDKIIKLLNIQNSKSALRFDINLDRFEETGVFTLFLLERAKSNGYNLSSMKKIFQTKVSIKAIIREIRLDIILGK